MKKYLTRFVAVFILFFVSACAQTSAKEAASQPLREILGSHTIVLNDATKWPKSIPVRSPDPIFGSASHLEVWSYDQRFAKRFEGFPEGQADPDMPVGLWAVVLRVYKQSYAPAVEGHRYSCQLELYVNDDVPVRASQISKSSFGNSLGELPSSVTTLVAKDSRDAQMLKNITPQFTPVPYTHTNRDIRIGNSYQRITGLQFTDGKLRGILNTFGVLDYHKNFLPGVQLMRTGVNYIDGGCEKFYPLAKESKMILRFGNTDPYDSYNRNMTVGTSQEPHKLSYPRGSLRSYPNLENNGIWHWTPQDPAKGLLALPDKLSKRGIEIVAMVRDLNQCIMDENAIQQGRYKATDDKKTERLRICKQLRDTGELYYTSGYDYMGANWLTMDVDWACPADFLSRNKNILPDVHKANTEWCAKPNPR
jgi:hypothetical protein